MWCSNVVPVTARGHCPPREDSHLHLSNKDLLISSQSGALFYQKQFYNGDKAVFITIVVKILKPILTRQ